MEEALVKFLSCPVCRSSMKKENGSLRCLGVRSHCFDVASAGYVNLASAKMSGGGDDAELIRARTSFLQSGHYLKISDAVCALLDRHAKGGVVLDAGCGEGYYSCQIAHNGMRVLGADLSKKGIMHAAKSATRESLSALFFVAGIFDLPVADACADAVVSLFAPVAEKEFLRVLKPGGVLLVVRAGEEHLLSLKRVLYDTPYLNEARADEPENMPKIAEEHLRYVTDLEKNEIMALFSMTPYYYRTSREGKARLAALQALSLDVDVYISVFQKK